MAASAAVQDSPTHAIRATPEHAAGIAELAARAFPDPWTAAAFASELARERARAWVVESEGRVAGYLLAARAADEADVLSFAVAPDWRQRGLGRVLLDACLRSLGAEGVRRLTLEVRSGNRAARALYAGCGLAPVGRRRRYYGDGEDAVLYGIELQ